MVLIPTQIKCLQAHFRAFSDHVGEYPALMKKFLLSLGEMVGRTSAMASHSVVMVLAAVFFRPALSFEKAFSMGFRSGL